jgi:hypothetical protein
MKSQREDNRLSETTSIRKARWSSLVFFSCIMIFLFSYSAIFKPKPPIQNSLIKSLDDSILTEGLRWYAKNSIGSFLLPEDEICTIFEDSSLNKCPLLTYSEHSQDDLYEKLLVLSKRKDLLPYIWKSYNPKLKAGISFSIFSVQIERIHALKKIPYPLGSLVETLPSYKRASLSPVTQFLFEEHSNLEKNKIIKDLNNKTGSKYQHVVFLKQHPMGYYLEIPPVP